MPKSTTAKKATRRSRVADKTTKTKSESANKVDEQADKVVQAIADEIKAISEVLNEDLPVEEEAETDNSDKRNPNAFRVEVSTADKLLAGMLGEYEIGTSYEFTYKHKLVGSVDSTVEGKLDVQVEPSKWAQYVAQNVYDACYVSDDTVDPSTVDASTDGWSGTLLV